VESPRSALARRSPVIAPTRCPRQLVSTHCIRSEAVEVLLCAPFFQVSLAHGCYCSLSCRMCALSHYWLVQHTRMINT
jgi:hypothetical protein